MGGCASSAPQGGSDFHDDYLLAKKLGEGSFAQVFLCKERFSKDPDSKLAVKVLDVTGNASARKDARKEAQLWQKIADGPNVVQLLSFSEDKRFCYLVMEKCHCTVLQAFLEFDDIGEKELSHCFRGMIEALQFIHSREIVHRDVKPDNFLLQADTGFSKDSVVKLCDFGLAAALPRKKPAGKSLASIAKSSGLTNVCGTAPYMAPEMLTPEKGGYDTAVDMWSMGVAGYLMMFGEFPYRPAKTGSKEMMEAIKANKPPSYKAKPGFPQPSNAACSFVQHLLKRGPYHRPDAEMALRHEFISDVKKPVWYGSDVDPKSISDSPTLPGCIRSDHRKQSFHQTLVVAQDIANKMEHYKVQGGDVVRFPSPDIKQNFENALMEMQREKAASLRPGKRTMSDPSEKLRSSITSLHLPQLSHSDTLRRTTRLSTHSGSFYKLGKEGQEEGMPTMSTFCDSEDAQSHTPSFEDAKSDASTDYALLTAPGAWKCVSEKDPMSPGYRVSQSSPGRRPTPMQSL